jgi:hypothetical protein
MHETHPRRETWCRQAVQKLISTSLHSKRYRPPAMPIHRQNSYAPRSKRRSSRRESDNKVRKFCIIPDMEGIASALNMPSSHISDDVGL